MSGHGQVMDNWDRDLIKTSFLIFLNSDHLCLLLEYVLRQFGNAVVVSLWLIKVVAFGHNEL